MSHRAECYSAHPVWQGRRAGRSGGRRALMQLAWTEHRARATTPPILDAGCNGRDWLVTTHLKAMQLASNMQIDLQGVIDGRHLERT